MVESNHKKVSLENEGIDRISELPDSILSIILSNLPTKYAVGTSILSTRWKNLVDFGFMPVKLHLDDLLLFNPRGDLILDDNFMDFVDKLFNVTLSDVACVEDIILHCEEKYGDDKVVSWVCTALRLNVRHLDLKISFFESRDWFHSLNGCTKLVTLRLWVECELLRLVGSFSLPNLKTLDLTELKFSVGLGEGDSLNQFIEGCPALEFLSLFRCMFWGNIHIKHPLLKTLVIEHCLDHSSSSLTLDTPNLEELTNSGFLAHNYYGCDLKCLHMAHIDIRPSDDFLDSFYVLLDPFEEQGFDDEDLSFIYNSTAMFVSRCSSTIRLSLSDCTIDGLHHSSMLLPMFCNLMWLSLGCLHWSILARLLQIAPKLEQLIIEEGFQKNVDGFADFMKLLPIQPECVALNMKRIEFRVFKEDEDETKLVEYFLKNGEVLQNLIVHCRPLDDISILTRLLTLPRQAKTCKIQCKLKQEMGV